MRHAPNAPERELRFLVNAIEVEGLKKSYEGFDAVSGIDFTVPAGQVFAFLGPNGAGKTTTVEILEGYRDRSSGHVRVLGHDPRTGGTEMRQRIGIVLQECGFPRFATVRELVILHAGYYPNPRPVDEVIELVGLVDKTNALIRTLSGGQKRRLDLALALVGDPELIFLDEPTTGFDPGARRDAWETVSNLRSLGKTIFLTTHYMDEAQHLADHVAVISRGKIVATGTPETLGGRDSALTQVSFAISDGPTPAIAGLDITVANGVATFATSNPAKDLHVLTGWALDAGTQLRNLSVSQPSLEDIYLELTREAQGDTSTEATGKENK